MVHLAYSSRYPHSSCTMTVQDDAQILTSFELYRTFPRLGTAQTPSLPVYKLVMEAQVPPASVLESLARPVHISGIGSCTNFLKENHHGPEHWQHGIRKSDSRGRECALPSPRFDAGRPSGAVPRETTNPRTSEVCAFPSHPILCSNSTRYFEPYDGPGPREGKARVATDPALTALAQLCAYKLNCQRSFISIITDAKQYMVAEATRR